MTIWQRIVFAIYAILASLYGDVPPPADEEVREHFRKMR